MDLSYISIMSKMVLLWKTGQQFLCKGKHIFIIQYSYTILQIYLRAEISKLFLTRQKCNLLVITYHNNSVAAIQHYSTKAVTDNAQTNGRFYVPVKVHLPKWTLIQKTISASLCSRETKADIHTETYAPCLKQLCNCQKWKWPKCSSVIKWINKPVQSYNGL